MWIKSDKSCIRNGDFLIVKFVWEAGTNYILWNKDTFMGRYGSADEAKGGVNESRTKD